MTEGRITVLVENTGGPFYRDPSCTEPDELLDDQALTLEVDEGLAVVLGCAHAGIVNTLDCVAESFPNRPIRMVLGGMHLVGALPSRIAHTIEVLRRYDIQRIGPAHCTDAQATRELCCALSQQCFLCNVGTQIAL